MQKIKWLIYTAYLLCWLATLFRCYLAYNNGKLLLMVGWMLAGGWVSWMIWALSKNKNLPVFGPFAYGSNQGGRVLYVAVFIVLYVIGCFYGQL